MRPRFPAFGTALSVRGLAEIGALEFDVRLTVGADLVYRFPKPAEVLLLVEAAHGPDQRVLSETLRLSPPLEVIRRDDDHPGERRAIVTASGELSITYRAEVEVAPRDGRLAGLTQSRIRDLPAEALRYLRPSRYCPSDRMERFVEREFSRWQGGDKVEAILAWIADHTDYVAGVSDPGTTALETFVDRAGVCRDFAHLTIALCRAAEIPARAVSAYAWKLDPPDMHAVAEVYVGGAWRLVDATCKAPVEGLVRVATGADAADIAFMSIFGAAELVRQAFTVEALETACPAGVAG